MLEAAGQEFEVSTPLGNLIPFFMQDKTYMRNTEFDVRFVVSSHFGTDMLVTKAVPATARNRGIETRSSRERPPKQTTAFSKMAGRPRGHLYGASRAAGRPSGRGGRSSRRADDDGGSCAALVLPGPQCPDTRLT